MTHPLDAVRDALNACIDASWYERKIPVSQCGAALDTLTTYMGQPCGECERLKQAFKEQYAALGAIYAHVFTAGTLNTPVDPQKVGELAGLALDKHAYMIENIEHAAVIADCVGEKP